MSFSQALAGRYPSGTATTATTKPLRAVRVTTREAMALAGLLVLSLLLRTQRMDVHFWIDEGLSVEVARHPLHQLPGLLRQDGAPPLYYALLHLWMSVFGDSESATHALSLLFASLCVPAAYLCGRAMLDRRAGAFAAVVAAFDPFLTSYAQETRMYSLVVLLGLLTTTSFVLAFVHRRRGARWAFAVLLALMLYTHNWSDFYIVATLVALAALWAVAADDRRALLVDAAQAYALALLLFLPWLPTFLFQAAHTGAPWARTPTWRSLTHAPGLLVGGQSGAIILLLAAGSGLVAMMRAGGRSRSAAVTLTATALLPILVAWLLSQHTSVWATRYLAAAAGPMLLLAGTGLARAGNLGVVGALLLVSNWIGMPGPQHKSNAHYVASTVAPTLHAGDTVIATQPEQVPVLRYYLPHGLKYATVTGPLADPGVVDWRDGVRRLEATSTARDLAPVLDAMPDGSRVVLVRPIIDRPQQWRAPWSALVAERSDEWQAAMLTDKRLKLMDVVPLTYLTAGPNPLQAYLFRKEHR